MDRPAVSPPRQIELYYKNNNMNNMNNINNNFYLTIKLYGAMLMGIFLTIGTGIVLKKYM